VRGREERTTVRVPMRTCGGDWFVLTISAIKFALIPMMAMSEIICTPLETAKVVSRAPDLWTGIFQALLGLNWEGVGSFSNTKREYFDPGGLFDFPLLTFSEFSPGGISDTKREYFHPMGLFDFWPVEVFDV
jgi:hypothetical protein